MIIPVTATSSMSVSSVAKRKGSTFKTLANHNGAQTIAITYHHIGIGENRAGTIIEQILAIHALVNTQQNYIMLVLSEQTL